MVKPPRAAKLPAVGSRPGEIGSLWEECDEVDVVDVVVGVEAPDLLPTYTYLVPELLRNSLKVGACVHVPFGGQEALGYVFGCRRVRAQDPLVRRLKPVMGPVEGAITFSEDQAAIAAWIAERYACDLASAVRCIAPAALGARVVRPAHLSDALHSGGDFNG